MMTLYEEGKWQLDDPVTKFIPEFADLKVMKDGELVPLDRPMTMRHLMSTSAGFAFGVPVGSTNPKVDEMYAAAGLWSGTNDDMIAKTGQAASGGPARHAVPIRPATGGSGRDHPADLRRGPRRLP